MEYLQQSSKIATLLNWKIWILLLSLMVIFYCDFTTNVYLMNDVLWNFIQYIHNGVIMWRGILFHSVLHVIWSLFKLIKVGNHVIDSLPVCCNFFLQVCRISSQKDLLFHDLTTPCPTKTLNFSVIFFSGTSCWRQHCPLLILILWCIIL